MQQLINKSEEEKGIESILNMQNFNIGDKVRVLKRTNPFDKGTEHWSKKIYTIIGILKFSYILSGASRTFRQHELLKINELETNPYSKNEIDEKQYKKEKKKIRKNKISAKELDANITSEGDLISKIKPLSQKRIPKEKKHFNIEGF